MKLGSEARLALILRQLAETIDARAETGAADTSYTAKLLSKGPHKPAKKLGEEAVELAIALTSQSDDEVVAETADVIYHLLVALRSREISLDQIADQLAKRQGLSGLDEKASRPAD